MFTKYGYSLIGIALIISFALIVFGIFINNLPSRIILILLALLISAFTLNFFRDPQRTIPEGDNIVVSPADGRVLFIKDVDGNPYITGKAKQISIFMSPLNVHVNRIPIDGVIKHAKYYKGKFLIAYDDKASTQNERAEFVIESKFGNVFFTQVAGFVARRLVYEIQPGDHVKKGERFGMIKFGSRVDVVVPADWVTNVKKEDDVTAGKTILFEIPEKK
ncbi:MAG: phosphatidylserine decarboxylase family protein [Ignavibacteriaceae bacterium]